MADTTQPAKDEPPNQPTMQPSSTQLTDGVSIQSILGQDDQDGDTSGLDSLQEPGRSGLQACDVGDHDSYAATPKPQIKRFNYSEKERAIILVAIGAARERLGIPRVGDKFRGILCDCVREILREPDYAGLVRLGMSNKSPCDKQLRDIWAHLMKDGKVCNRTYNSGRKKDMERRQKVLEVAVDPSLSLRQIAKKTGVSVNMAHRTLKENKMLRRVSHRTNAT